MKTYGIIGSSLTHSFSKEYFTEKIEREKVIDAVFYKFPLKSIEEFPLLLASEKTLVGLAVTIPYKEQVLKYVTYQSDEVIQIGAANCLKIKEGRLMAYNTDIVGFERSFVKHLKAHHKKALLLGTGGASKAVQYVLTKLGIEFLVVSRNEIATPNALQYYQLTNALIEEYNVIINATPLGMSPAENTCPELPYDFLTPNHYLYDLVYAPYKTLFLRKGSGQGAVTENGFDMLIIQAEENWRIWNAE